ncbi:MAG: hypothetical protein FWE42_04830 [Defluviitaleaceae bacterium]|nr:hypothetical protein [Defluviitaleaceae bacterium]
MTKKYNQVYQPLIERFLEEESRKKSPDSIKAVKTKLHQVYGAYTQDNAHKKAGRILDELRRDFLDGAVDKGVLCCGRQIAAPTKPGISGVGAATCRPQTCICKQPLDCQNIKGSTAKTLLSLHASTKERLPHYPEFYDFILQHTGPVETILDIGCGYNPFAIPLIPDIKLKAYHAYDIDIKVADLLNRFFEILGLPPLAGCADLAVTTPTEEADIGLMCKLLPVLEAQVPGRGFELVRGLNTNFLLITYPLKSLGGREKGMGQHYADAFNQALSAGELGKYALVGHKHVGSELLYLLQHKK